MVGGYMEDSMNHSKIGWGELRWNLVSPKPLGSPVVKVTITGRAGSTSATITIVMWTYLIQCAVMKGEAYSPKEWYLMAEPPHSKLKQATIPAGKMFSSINCTEHCYLVLWWLNWFMYTTPSWKCWISGYHLLRCKKNNMLYTQDANLGKTTLDRPAPNIPE